MRQVGRSEGMEELLRLMQETYSEYILGSDINMVKHLFHYLKSDRREFEFIYNDDPLPCAVEEIDTDKLTLVVPDFKEKGLRRARLKFEVMNTLFQFEVQILDIEIPMITVKIPSELQSIQLRTKRRIPVDDLFMNFIILFRSLSGGQREIGKNLYVESKFPHLMREVRKDNPDLKLLNMILTDCIHTVSKEYEIVFYDESNFEYSDPFEEFIQKSLRKSGKSIYIPSCTKIENYYQETDTEGIINYREAYLEKIERDGEPETNRFFRDFQKKELRDFYVSYVYTPIKMYDIVKGHIKVFTTAMDKHSIMPSQAEYLNELSEIISYGFTKVAIKHSSFDSFSSSTRVVDISIDGLLFELENEVVFQYLKRHNIIKMFLPIYPDRTIAIRGEIKRSFLRDGKFYCGVMFFDSNPDDMYYLEKYLFEKGAMTLSE